MPLLVALSFIFWFICILECAQFCFRCSVEALQQHRQPLQRFCFGIYSKLLISWKTQLRVSCNRQHLYFILIGQIMSGSDAMEVSCRQPQQRTKSWFIFDPSLISHILNNQSIKLTSIAALTSRIGTKKCQENNLPCTMKRVLKATKSKLIHPFVHVIDKIYTALPQH